MRVVATILVVLVACIGCASTHRAEAAGGAQTASFSEELSQPVDIVALDAAVVPPLDWKPDPIKSSPQHEHQVWISPVGGTAYGVIYFTLPLPVGEEIALRGFLSEMKKTEGEATLLSKIRDGDRLRFEAEGGKYRIRGIILTRGFHGWVAYAGTLRGRAIVVDDLELAVKARENTALGLGHD